MNATLRHAAGLALLAAALAIPQLAPAQQGPYDLLDRERALREVAIQKAEAEVRLAMEDALRLEQTSPVRAVNRLQQVLVGLRSDTVLPEQNRNALIRRVSERIRGIEARSGRLANPANPAPRPPVVQQERERTKALVAERESLRKGLDTIAALQRAGRTDEARREADALYRRFPNNPAAIALTSNQSMNDRIFEARALLAEQDKRVVMALRDVDRSALPPIGDIEFPKDWKERTARRNKTTLSPRDQAILKALNTEVNLRYKNVPFEEVIQDLSDLIKQPILLDKTALADAGVDSNTMVSVNLKGVAARTGLRKVLGDQNLTFIVKDGTLQVVSPLRAREMLVTKVYYLGDLIQGLGPFNGGAVNWGPWIDQAQTMSNAAALAEMIQKSIDPDSWRGSGLGQGTITFHYPSMSFIVRQTAEVHALLSGTFRGR